MKIEEFFNQRNIVDLSFFNFRNAITAAYFANEGLEVQKVNDNFQSFFPVLGNVTNVYFPHVLEQLGVSGSQIGRPAFWGGKWPVWESKSLVFGTTRLVCATKMPCAKCILRASFSG